MVVVANVLDCNIKESAFKLQSFYYVYFQSNNLEKGMNPFINHTYGLNCITSVLLAE